MTKNVGGIDRVIRIVGGLALAISAALGVLGPWAWLGLILLATGVFSFCLPYKLFGFNTCSIKTDV